jgi:HK97 family phage portal protein
MQNSPLDKAWSDAQRSYVLAKAAAADIAADVLATPGGLGSRQTVRAMTAAEQAKAFRGWVYSAIRPIAQAIAGQPIRVGKPKRPGRTKQYGRKFFETYEPVEQHAVLDLLADPSELTVGWSLIFTLVASLELTGKAFLWVTDIDGRKSILNLPTSWIIDFEGTTSYQTWHVRPPGHSESFPIDSSEMVYVAYPDPGDPHGAVSPLMAAAAAVEIDQALLASQRQMMRSGLMPKLALLVGKTAGIDGAGATRPQLSGAQRRQLVRTIQQIWSRTVTDGDPAILDGLIEDVKRIQATPAEMDFLQSGDAVKKRILQAFGTPAAVLGEELTNLASSRAADAHFARYCVNPKIELISQCLTEWRGAFGVPPGEKLAIWIEPLPVKDDELTIRKWTLLGQYGAGTKDEMRADFGLPPMPNHMGTLPLEGPTGMEAAVSRFVTNEAHSAAGEYIRVSDSHREHRERQNGKQHAH